MGERVPTVYLLVGLTGAGKTTYARRVLEPGGVVRLAVDEVVFARYGRYGVDYPASEYFAIEAPVVAELRGQLGELVAAGRDVVWDHGLWPRGDREALKAVVEATGGRWRLLYFPVGRGELLRRLAERNRRGGANALPVTAADLDDFIGRFEVPVGEGEEIVGPEWFGGEGLASGRGVS
ncbi:hypothetical protein CFP65_6754 [Kitasatospora sp. MMS16-BH015]|uniref:ATP-binding protein n=1 Tax=Kitasatospora sp. MMS16-BH015 TaxID=2018025 RepID=UPI000CA3177F|nr:ATP-binding protein [Kitasatospora sp. MMS16-BH015]AUG81394.1 hypothetical protein CFP65_6754 [Kitasatospora sp. MMS16-BH015]